MWTPLIASSSAPLRGDYIAPYDKRLCERPFIAPNPNSYYIASPSPLHRLFIAPYPNSYYIALWWPLHRPFIASPSPHYRLFVGPFISILNVLVKGYQNIVTRGPNLLPVRFLFSWGISRYSTANSLHIDEVEKGLPYSVSSRAGSYIYLIRCHRSSDVTGHSGTWAVDVREIKNELGCRCKRVCVGVRVCKMLVSAM